VIFAIVWESSDSYIAVPYCLNLEHTAALGNPESQAKKHYETKS
jgi:hypothetical protein